MKEFLVRYKSLLLSFIIMLSFFVFFIKFNTIEANGKLKVFFLDIGQGNSTFLISPENQKVLIDTGSNYISSQKVEKYMPFLSKTIDILILTHPDLDHVGGTQDILDNFFVKNIFISSENAYYNYNISDFTKVFSLNSEHISNLGHGLKLSVLSPFSSYFKETNENSIVNSLEFGNFQFIFMGDATSEIERSLIAKGFFQSSSKKVLLVGHHGSDTSSSEVFLKKIKPEYCIISVGKNNKYGHPSREVVGRLEKYCKSIYRTDMDGDIIFETDGSDLVIENKK